MLNDAATGVVSSSTQLDELLRPVSVADTDNGKTFTELSTYTPVGQLQTQTFGSAASVVAYQYYPSTSVPANGSAGALQNMTVLAPNQGSTSTNYNYDPTTQRLKTIEVNGIAIQYLYLPNSNQVQTVTFGGADTNGNLSGVGDVTVTYTPQASDPARPIDISAADVGGATLFDDSIAGYNNNDQRSGETITRALPGGGTHTDTLVYGYDPNQADALTSVTDNGSPTSYAFDSAGDYTTPNLGGANLLSQYANFTYNGRGDITNDGQYTYRYDAMDRLISVAPNNPIVGSTGEQYGYDSQGRRLWKDVYTWNGSAFGYSYSRHYVWDSSNDLIAVEDANGNLITGYTWGADGLDAVTDYTASGGPKTYAVVKDASGNTAALIDPISGAVAAVYTYTPYGGLASMSGPAANVCEILGKGYITDHETPWLGFAPNPSGDGSDRVINFNVNLFMQRDSAGPIAGGFNLYQPFGNDPINNSDPNGLSPKDASDQVLTPYLNNAMSAINKDPSLLIRLNRYNIGVLLPRLVFYDSWASAGRGIGLAYSTLRGDLSNAAATTNSTGEKALYNGIKLATYPMQATSYAAVTYSQAELTGIGALSRLRGAQPFVKPIVLTLTAAKAGEVGALLTTPAGRDSLTVNDFTDLGAGLAGSFALTGGVEGPFNPLNWRLNLTGEVVDGQVTFGANRFLRFAPSSGPSPRVTHDLYVKGVLGPGAGEQPVPTPWSEGRTGIRVYDGLLGRNVQEGILFEGNTTDWENMNWETFNRKITQIATDARLLSGGQVKRVIWFGTQPLPAKGLGGVVAADLRAAGIQYYVVTTK